MDLTLRYQITLRLIKSLGKSIILQCRHYLYYVLYILYNLYIRIFTKYFFTSWAKINYRKTVINHVSTMKPLSLFSLFHLAQDPKIFSIASQFSPLCPNALSKFDTHFRLADSVKIHKNTEIPLFVCYKCKLRNRNNSVFHHF